MAKHKTHPIANTLFLHDFIILFASFLFACFGNLFAQDPIVASKSTELSLKQAIDLAYKHAPQIKIAKLKKDERLLQLQQAKAAAFVPDMSLNVLGGVVPDLPVGFGPAFGFPDYDPSLKDLGPFILARFTMVQPLFVFNKINNLRKAAEFGVESEAFAVIAQNNEIHKQVESVYWAHSYALSLQDFIKEILDKIKQAKETVEERLETGSEEVSDIDLMRIKVFENETLRRKADVEAGLELSAYTLKLLIGKKAEENLIIEDKKLNSFKFDLKSMQHYLDRAHVARPEYQQIEMGVKAQEHLKKVQWADYYPSFFIAGQWDFTYAPGRVPIDNPYVRDPLNSNTGGVTLGLRQNLAFPSISARYKLERAKYNTALAQQDLAKQAIELDVRKKYLDLRARKEAFLKSQMALKSARSWVLSSTLNFGAGLVSARDLLESFGGYSSVKAGFFDVLLKYRVAQAELRQAVGEDI